MAVTSIVMKNQTNFGGGDATATSVAHTIGVVESPMTLYVGSGQDFSTLQEAMDWVEARVLLAETTIQIVDGTYNFSSTNSLTHPNYSMVNIVGNTATPSNVVFNLSGVIYGIFVNGTQLKSLQGIKFVGGQVGIACMYGGRMKNVYKCECWDQTYMSVVCYYHSYLNANNVIADNCGAAHGFHCYVGSTMLLTSPISRNHPQYGIAAQFHSAIKIAGTPSFSGNTSGDYFPGLNANPSTTNGIIRND